MDIGSISRSLADRTRLVGPAYLPERFMSLAETFAAGEPEVALEGLLSNVDEFDIPIGPHEFAALSSEAERLGLRPSEWQGLSRLVVDPAPGDHTQPPNR